MRVFLLYNIKKQKEGFRTEKVVIGMSGGVDSSVAAVLLKKSGYSVTGATLILYNEDEACLKAEEKNISDAKAVCERLNIPHTTFDMRKEFGKYVIGDFISEYTAGRTPNPCIRCNRYVKFSSLIEKGKEAGTDKIATGHYAKITFDKVSGRYLLSVAEDRAKDQTYVLYSLTQNELSKAVMPLGNITKSEVRAIAEEYGFINASRPDSQDICFVPDSDYAAFIERRTGIKYPPGDFTDENGKVLGKHSGIINYTVGQRKGLGIALGHPVFVLSKDASKNLVVLGEETSLLRKRVTVQNPNFIPFETLNGGMKVSAKLRYSQKPEASRIEMAGDNTLVIEFEKPQRAPSPGQSAVFYDGDTVVGGGIIIG